MKKLYVLLCGVFLLACLQPLSAFDLLIINRTGQTIKAKFAATEPGKVKRFLKKCNGLSKVFELEDGETHFTECFSQTFEIPFDELPKNGSFLTLALTLPTYSYSKLRKGTHYSNAVGLSQFYDLKESREGKGKCVVVIVEQIVSEGYVRPDFFCIVGVVNAESETFSVMESVADTLSDFSKAVKDGEGLLKRAEKEVMRGARSYDKLSLRESEDSRIKVAQFLVESDEQVLGEDLYGHVRTFFNPLLNKIGECIRDMIKSFCALDFGMRVLSENRDGLKFEALQNRCVSLRERMLDPFQVLKNAKMMMLAIYKEHYFKPRVDFIEKEVTKRILEQIEQSQKKIEEIEKTEGEQTNFFDLIGEIDGSVDFVKELKKRCENYEFFQIPSICREEILKDSRLEESFIQKVNSLLKYLRDRSETCKGND